MGLFSRRKPAVQKDNSARDALLQMVDRTQAVIHFQPDGTILEANDNFLGALGYTSDEIVGKKHAMFVDTVYADSPEYAEFWRMLNAGEAFTDRYPRRTKEGETIWINATYAPVFDDKGTVVRVVKIATDITKRQRVIEAISDALARLESGDLTHRLPDTDIKDLNSVGQAYNRAVKQISTLVSKAKSVADTLRGASAEIKDASMELSRRTETQAATLEETAAAVQVLTSSASSAAEGARNVDTVASETRHAAEESGKLVDDVIAAMDRIEKSSDQISQIIGVIDDIAFQTNLLALNAGVEAARAGDAGRGFAVVASEVRSLAQRSAESAQEIKNLISESSDHVGTGADLVRRASHDLNRIFEGVGTISDDLKGITRTLTDQSTSLTEINVSISELDRVTQQNSAMVQETTDASQVLASNSETVAAEVSYFRTDPNSVTWGGATAAAAPSKAKAAKSA